MEQGYSVTKYSAFSLLEVLLSITVFSVILLALMAWQLDLLRNSYQDYFRSVAIVQTQSMLERLRVNHSDSARQREYVLWNDINMNVLPQGHGDYSCRQFDHHCLVTLHWRAAGPQAYSLAARIA
ncbi:MAG: prepilin-type N-terminal cleavage/methylation domain-containing protein [Coxiellaceae bacterium]|nr:prepilin-type N-terminal cleavage/methylation domain-containing protein [Coxiellaceae bacterium]